MYIQVGAAESARQARCDNLFASQEISKGLFWHRINASFFRQLSTLALKAGEKVFGN